MSLRRRYEILLPLQFNDNRAVPEALLLRTVEELEGRFRSVSWETQVVRGIWQHEGVVFRDNNTRLVLDVEDSPENRAFFVALKEVPQGTFSTGRYLDYEPRYRCGLEAAFHFMCSITVPTEISDPVNARILAVSEDRIQGFQPQPFHAIARQTGLEPALVVERIRAMLEAGTIRRVRQTLLATNLAQGALVAWQMPAEKLDAAFDFMFGQDPFSGHVVLRSTDTASAGSNYKLWTTVKVPQGFSLLRHCQFLAPPDRGGTFSHHAGQTLVRPGRGPHPAPRHGAGGQGRRPGRRHGCRRGRN